MSNMNDNLSDIKNIFWACDKVDCLKGNYRQIPKDCLLYSDTCDHCKTRIHEPIVENVKELKK